MKRLWAVLLAFAVLFSCGAVVFATDNDLEILPIGPAIGDVDMDGDTNIKDATLVQKYVASLCELSEKQLFLADADLDTNVNIKDATYIQKQIAGLLKPAVPSNPVEGTEEPTEDPMEEPTSDELPKLEEDCNRYFFYMPPQWINKYSATAGIYWWEGTNACTAWPGYKANRTDVDGVYYYDVPTDVTYIIWNNFLDGGMDIHQDIYKASVQTTDIYCVGYEPGENENIPEGTDGFNGMIYVVDFHMTEIDHVTGKINCTGQWCYYYGNGKYGFSPVEGNGEVFNEPALNWENNFFAPEFDSTEGPTEEPTQAVTDPIEAPAEKPSEEPTQAVTDPTEASTEKPTEEPTQAETDPTEDPTEPTTDPTKVPTEDPTEPTTDPTEPPVEEPTEPDTDPIEPPVEEPTEPDTDPTEPPVEEPTEPDTDPIEPPVEEPTEPDTDPTEPPTEEPTEPTTKDKDKPIELPFIPAL